MSAKRSSAKPRPQRPKPRPQRAQPRADTATPPARIRLAKLLAQRGIAARRKAEELIASGAVTVNGEVAAVVTLVDPETDVIAVNGKPIPAPSPLVYYLIDKPAGYITGRSDPQGRPSVLDFCKDLPAKVEPVGRLDYDTWGALLLTNDGTLAHRLTHPSRQVPKRYVGASRGHAGRGCAAGVGVGHRPGGRTHGASEGRGSKDRTSTGTLVSRSR